MNNIWHLIFTNKSTKEKGCNRSVNQMSGDTQWTCDWNSWGKLQTGINFWVESERMSRNRSSEEEEMERISVTAEKYHAVKKKWVIKKWGILWRTGGQYCAAVTSGGDMTRNVGRDQIIDLLKNISSFLHSVISCIEQGKYGVFGYKETWSVSHEQLPW